MGWRIHPLASHHRRAVKTATPKPGRITSCRMRPVHRHTRPRRPAAFNQHGPASLRLNPALSRAPRQRAAPARPPGKAGPPRVQAPSGPHPAQPSPAREHASGVDPQRGQKARQDSYGTGSTAWFNLDPALTQSPLALITSGADGKVAPDARSSGPDCAGCEAGPAPKLCPSSCHPDATSHDALA